MQEDNLTETIGVLVCAERNRAKMSQARLAERIGVSQQRLSRIERGTVSASLSTVQRIFADLGRQLRVEAVPLRSDMDRTIDHGLTFTDDDRVEEMGRHGRLLGMLGDIPFAVAGRLAAFLQGAPIERPSWVDILVARRDLDELSESMEKTHCRRWSDRWKGWGFGATDPRLPGAYRWMVGLSDTRLHVVDQLPRTLPVCVEENTIRVVPIAELERVDPWLHRLMSRWRERAEAPA